MMHCGTEEISLEDLRQLTTPQPEKSEKGLWWMPIPHFSFQEQIRESLASQGYNVVGEGHAITHNRKQGNIGDRYFGFLQLGNGDDNGTCEVVGLRNAHDKTFSASLVMGMGVFVCDNLSFSGEVRVSRRHTLNIGADMPNLAAQAVGMLGDLRGWQETRINAYREAPLESRRDVHDLIMQSFRAHCLPPSQIGRVVDAWDAQPTHETYAEEFGERNMWSLFNAFTEVYKNRTTPHVLSQRTRRLHGVFDAHLGLARPTEFAEV